jgi:hypothetical protein
MRKDRIEQKGYPLGFESKQREGRKMGAGTVFPEAVMEAAGTFATTLESAAEEWLTDVWDEETSDVVSLIRELRRNIQHFPRDFKQFLSRGVDASRFVKRWEPILDRHGDSSASVSKVVEAIRARGSAPRNSAILTELEGMGEDMGAAMDFLRNILAHMKVRRPIDWMRVEAAQAAYERGEMKPFRGLTGAEADKL